MSFNPDRVNLRTGTRSLAKKCKQPLTAERRKLLADHERALAKLGVKPKEAPKRERLHW